MELLASYGKLTRLESHALAVVVSADVIGCNGRPIDLRAGAQLPKFVRGVAYSRSGCLLVPTAEGPAVEHPDGRVVPLVRAGAAMHEPVFVGDALVLQDDPSRGAGLAIFDVETGALRGRLEHERTRYGATSVVEAAVVDAGDGSAWVSDRTSLRRWDLRSVRCAERVELPPGLTCFGVDVLPGGGLVTNVRPEGGDVDSAELAVFRGGTWARRRLRCSSVVVVGEQVWATTLDARLRADRLLALDADLADVEALELAPTLGVGELRGLWAGRREVLAVGWHNQVHHVGDAALRPTGARVPAPVIATARQRRAGGGRRAP